MRVKKLLRVAAALSAIGAGYFAYLYLTLPDVSALRSANPATTAFMDLRAAEARSRGEAPRRNHRWVAYGRIAPALRRAVLVAEDSAFWAHDGIDVEQIRASLEHDLERGRISRGGSTITQQLAKNLYLSPSKNPFRKLRELLIARRLEAELSKARILEIYLNVIEWGDGVYGAEAAARAYFGKPASALDTGEAAMLAGCIINPRLLNPSKVTPRLLRRQRLILSRMGTVSPPPDTGAPAPPVPPSL
ncbi:MAG: monofunctional biosynthetic peptidoglycan transglycosylase [Acidobacteria bacterium]|nr:MAG: monofunctional biosynthetic peptidoglycan transglycosylase [Acidobacteriota bacterium]